jgi:hypothetical protein
MEVREDCQKQRVEEHMRPDPEEQILQGKAVSCRRKALSSESDELRH